MTAQNIPLELEYEVVIDHASPQPRGPYPPVEIDMTHRIGQMIRFNYGELRPIVVGGNLNRLPSLDEKKPAIVTGNSMMVYETNKQAFNLSVKHLLTQKKKSTGTYKSYNCCGLSGPLYKNKIKNLECPIGCLIPNDIYYHDMEGLSIEYVLQEYGAIRNLFRNINRDMLKGISEIHDKYHPNAWKKKLTEFYNKYSEIYDLGEKPEILS